MIRGKDEIFKALTYATQYFNEVFPLDCMAAVTDGEKFIAYYPGEKIDVGAKVGERIPENDPTLVAFRSGRTLTAEVPREAYGFAFKAVVIPLRDENRKVIGTLNAGIDLTTQNELIDIAAQLSANIHDSSAGTEEVAASAQSLNDSQQDLTALVQKAGTNLEQTNEILALIRNVAAQTNLLGLNASIEAARAGEQGRGFGVVADEIRKLSENSARSTQNIEEILRELRNLLEQITAHTDITEKIAKDQGAAIEEIAATMQQVSLVANRLTELARIL